MLSAGSAAGLDLKDKPVAVFGLGDSIGYGEYFCDAMEEIYSTFKATGAKMVGHWPTDGYDHEGSKVGSHPSPKPPSPPALHLNLSPRSPLPCRYYGSSLMPSAAVSIDALR